MRRQQGGGINFKAPQRIIRHVPGGPNFLDSALPQQQPAALLRRSFFRFAKKCCMSATCQFDVHSHLCSMGTGESILEGIFASTGQRLDKALAEASGLSRERVKALIGEGHVAIGGTPTQQATAKPAAGTAWRITIPQAIAAAAAPQDIALTIAFEDEHLIVIDKPAGMVVHPAVGNLDGTLVNALLHHCAGQLSGIGGVARPGIVHRIDKDTSGLLVAAKSNPAHEGLARQFADHSIERAYLAVAAGHLMPLTGTVTGAIARSSHDRKKMALVDDGRGKHAVTHFKTLERLGSTVLAASSLIECRLETGRTHQVRVHMSSIGHGLLGDPVYGRTPPRLRPMLTTLGFRRQALHAAILGFNHPIGGQALRFSSALPVDMEELLIELRNNS